MAGVGGPAALFKNGWEVEGVVPGALPNRWLLAACNIVGGDPKVAARCFVDATHAAQGFYVVRFFVDDPCSEDNWRVVLVDDRLLCGANGAPCFARCPTISVLWVALIEKACVKLCGCYEATVGEMTVDDGLVLLTGGHAKSIEAQASQADALWQELMNAWTCSSVIGCEHQSRSGAAAAKLLATGLVPGQAYCAVTGGEMAPGRLIRLRALHGSPEWNGKWSDDDPSRTSQLRNLMHYSKNGNDGTLWIRFYRLYQVVHAHLHVPDGRRQMDQDDGAVGLGGRVCWRLPQLHFMAAKAAVAADSTAADLPHSFHDAAYARRNGGHGTALYGGGRLHLPWQ
jgi:hypothetical protein